MTEIRYLTNPHHAFQLVLQVKSMTFGGLSGKFQAEIKKPGTVVAQWLWCCATNRKVAGSIPAGVIGIFH